jgi:UDPglucose 6-dehydrogenase
MNIAIIGTGHVGLITGACLAERGHKVLCVDSDERKVKLLKSLKMPIYEPDLEPLVARNVKSGRLKFGGSNADAVAFGKVIFICVPTPPTASGGADLSYIEAVSRDIARSLQEYRLIVEKSTVPVRTGGHVRSVIGKYAKKGADFDVASNPEFLREGSAIPDTLHPDRIVFGVETRRAEMVLRDVYKPFKAPIVVTDIKSAELIKHASNSFLALKISYANALAAVCERAGASVTEVVRGMGMDARIGASFLNAGIGYGGSCFPKDVAAFESISRDLGYDFGLLREVMKVNQDARERFVKKVEEELWIVKGKVICALGLSFKPNTDDLRESVGLAVVQRLADRGAKVRAYDPQAMEKAKGQLKDVTLCSSPYEAAQGADCALLLTEWDEFKALDWKRVKKAMAHPTLIDGRNLFDPAKMRELGFTYRSVGRP